MTRAFEIQKGSELFESNELDTVQQQGSVQYCLSIETRCQHRVQIRLRCVPGCHSIKQLNLWVGVNSQRRLYHLQLQAIPVTLIPLLDSHIAYLLQFTYLSMAHLVVKFFRLTHLLQLLHFGPSFRKINPYFTEGAKHLAGRKV